MSGLATSEDLCSRGRWINFTECFLPIDSEIITSIPLCTRRVEDFWSWHYDRRGIFSVQTAYRMLAEVYRRRSAWLDEKASSSNREREEKEWTMLWKTQVPSKIQVFL
jgi:hypothetical protein